MTDCLEFLGVQFLRVSSTKSVYWFRGRSLSCKPVVNTLNTPQCLSATFRVATTRRIHLSIKNDANRSVIQRTTTRTNQQTGRIGGIRPIIFKSQFGSRRGTIMPATYRVMKSLSLRFLPLIIDFSLSSSFLDGYRVKSQTLTNKTFLCG